MINLNLLWHDIFFYNAEAIYIDNRVIYCDEYDRLVIEDIFSNNKSFIRKNGFIHNALGNKLVIFYNDKIEFMED